ERSSRPWKGRRRLMAVKEQVSAGARVSAGTAKRGGGFPWGKVGRYTAVVLMVFVCFAPLYWSIATAVKSGLELNASPPTLFPHTFSLENFQTDLSLSTFTHDLLNSTIIAAVTKLLALLVGILFVYAISRMNFRVKCYVLGILFS